MLIDTHCHLNADQFNDDLNQVINNALETGVKKMIVVGFDHETNKRAIELAHEFDFIYATVGFHPTEAKDITEEDFKILWENLQDERVVGIGECGLDYYWDKDHKKAQEWVFRKQIEWSKKLDLPLIIHMRDATDATYQILKEYEGLKGIMHCYSGSKEMVKPFVDLGLHISLGGPVTFKNAKVPKEVAKVIPDNRLLVETDSPYLSPHPLRGKRNEPARVRLVAECVADLREETIEKIEEITTKNAMKLFKLGVK